jgi:hypothetical protein
LTACLEKEVCAQSTISMEKLIYSIKWKKYMIACSHAFCMYFVRNNTKITCILIIILTDVHIPDNIWSDDYDQNLYSKELFRFCECNILKIE